MIGIEVLAYIDLVSNFFFELAQLTQKKCCRMVRTPVLVSKQGMNITIRYSAYYPFI